MEKTKWKRPLMFMIGLKHENKDYALDEKRKYDIWLVKAKSVLFCGDK